jgi:hypothetical protein
MCTAPSVIAGGAGFISKENITMNTIITKDGLIVDTAVLLRERAYRCALAYVAAVVSATLDYVERTTGCCDYDDYSDVVSVEKVQALSRAESTSEHARKIVADAELMHQLQHNCPQLGALAKDFAGDLLATL